jgi:hypothetical protein
LIPRLQLPNPTETDDKLAAHTANPTRREKGKKKNSWLARRVISRGNGAALSICLRVYAKLGEVEEEQDRDGAWGGVGAAEESGARRLLMAGVVRGGGSRRRLRTGVWRMDATIQSNPIRIHMDFTMRFDFFFQTYLFLLKLAPTILPLFFIRKV